MIKKDLYSKDSGLVFIFSYIAMFVGQAVLLVFTGLTTDLPDWAVWTALALNQGAFFIASSFYVSAKKQNPFKLAGFNNKLSGKQMAYIPLFAVALMIAAAPLAMMFSTLVHSTGYDVQSSLPDMTSPTTIIMGIIFICVFPAIGEEFLFRNAVLRGFKRRGYYYAAVISSLMFCLMHGNPDQLVHQFFVGLMLAYVMQVTGNLLAPMILHFSNNFLALLIDFFISDQLLASADEGIVLSVMVIMIVLGMPLLFLVMKGFLKLEKEKRKEQGYEMESEEQTLGYQTDGGGYLGAIMTLIKFIFSFKARKQLKEKYNRIMLSLDRTPALPPENEDELMRMLVRNEESLGFVYVAIIGSAIMVGITYIGGVLS
jgi:membrane protease YdiL (CAAX protease family)